MKLSKTSLWATLVALLSFCGCEATAGTIPPFRLLVPVPEVGCANDGQVRDYDTDPVTLNVQARGPWFTVVKTFFNVPRETPTLVEMSTPAGASGYCLVSWRCSEPGTIVQPAGIIGCWSDPVGMTALGW